MTTIHYVRISNHNTTAHADAQATQLKAFPDEPDRTIIDAGVSGLKPPLDRKGFAALVLLAETCEEEGEELTVRVTSRDRLGRNRAMEDAIEILHELGVKIVTPEGEILPADRETNQEWLMSGILQLFSEYERRELVSKLARGKASAKALGRHVGGAVPFGFEVEGDGFLIEIPEEQEQIRCFLAEVKGGSSIRAAMINCGIPKKAAYRLASEVEGE